MILYKFYVILSVEYFFFKSRGYLYLGKSIHKENAF